MIHRIILPIVLAIICYPHIFHAHSFDSMSSSKEKITACIDQVYTPTAINITYKPIKEFQNSTDTGKCSSPEFSQFDFWIGDWELTWNDTLHGTNLISRTLDGCVIHEQFSDPNSKFFGQSFSVYDPIKKQWQQTWVDNQGYYMTFIGGMVDREMILSRSILNKDGKELHQRMVFFNIRTNSLDWSWQSSTDGGQNWKQNWLIRYRRK
jgi:hypothetical protein